jgi:hypothetical protein
MVEHRTLEVSVIHINLGDLIPPDVYRGARPRAAMAAARNASQAAQRLLPCAQPHRNPEKARPSNNIRHVKHLELYQNG